MDKLIFALNLIVDFIDYNETVNESELANYLLFTGFDDYEIRQILALIGINDKLNRNGFRIFTKKEKHLFSKEAINYIEKLFLAGIIDFVDGEEIIERAINEENYQISVDQIKEHTLIILLEKQSNLYYSKGIEDETTH